MEGKKLNLDQPFLSVRRQTTSSNSPKDDDKRKTGHFFSVLPWLPSYRSELKSGPVSNPGAVPFLWEQIPGQPKEERGQEIQDFDGPPIAPKLPPGRNQIGSQHFPRKYVPNASDDIPRDVKNDALLDENVITFEGGKEKMEESSESGDSCDEFTDARDTLSRTESFFLNCSVSGVSEFDDLDAKSKPQGSLPTNSKSRDLMMDRFLPAAKAMASEVPKYGQKKPHVALEQPQQLKKILMQEQPSLRYGPSYARQYSEFRNYEEESDDECDQPEHLALVCGLLPRFCLRNSLCVLNPVPAMSMRSHLPISPSNKLQPKSSSSGSYSETENESRSDISEPRSVDKIQVVEFQPARSRLRNEQGNSHRHKALTISFSEEKQLVEEAKKSRIKGTRLHMDGCKTFGDFLADHDESLDQVDSECPVLEKTVYVDTVHKAAPKEPLSPRTLVTKRLDEVKSIRSSPEDTDSMDPKNPLLVVTDKFVSSAHILYVENGVEMPRTCKNTNEFEHYPSAAENTPLAEKEAALAFCELPAPPPLPQSPSDSWLSRTLPSASRKNLSHLSRRSSLGEQTNAKHHGLRQQQRMLNEE